MQPFHGEAAGDGPGAVRRHRHLTELEVNEGRGTADTGSSMAAFDPVDTFLVKQDIEYFEAATGFETENSYQVLGASGMTAVLGPVVAKESSGVLARMCCGTRRPWTIRLAPPQPLLVIQRPFKWLFQEIRVYSGPDGRFLGTVRRDSKGWPFQKNFSIDDASGAPLLKVTCPFLSFGWNFTLRDLEGCELGHITKKWAGVLQECFTDADNFGVGFPIELPGTTKALLLAAVFLIDFCFFEDNAVQHSNRRR